MVNRSDQENAREWLLSLSAGNDKKDAHMAVVILSMLAERRGPMVEIRARGPVSISQIEDTDQ